ncbi:hypothetical protein BU17DRAFT_66051 [Hysterangium stoloniferum]|nr:hypothetical protein BU17DRAFT_66051 [Hysterangium stoloniferum]
MLNGFFPNHHDQDFSFFTDDMSGTHAQHTPHIQMQMQQPQPSQQPQPPQQPQPHHPQQQPHPSYPADPNQQPIHRIAIDSNQNPQFPGSAQKQEGASPPGELPRPGAGAAAADDKKGPGKSGKTLNRVPRACNACRKQKMRCEGAENPPCRRCRHTGLECLFEKPTREPTLTGEAGLERIRNLEAQVTDIRHSQHNIHNTLLELVSQLRGTPHQFRPHQGQSPAGASPYHMHSPASSLGGASTAVPMMDPSLAGAGPARGPPSHSSPAPSTTLPPMLSPGLKRPPPTYPLPPPPPAGFPGPFPPPHHVHHHHHNMAGTPLPPPSDIVMAPPRRQDSLTPQHHYHHRNPSGGSGSGGKNDNGKRAAPSSSNVTSANSSDEEEEETSELPAEGLVAPWEVLRGLADAAAERAAKENGSSDPSSRARSHSPLPVPPHFHLGHSGNEELNGQPKPAKRRKTHHRHGRTLAFPDVVTKNIITEHEARELFKIFYQGCNTFLPVFDSQVDTFDALHERSPFAVDCICMVAARVQCGGGPPSEVFKRCLEEVQSICCATLFSPVSRQEAVQAMVVVSGWSDNGWLSGGHAVRMALELGMNKAWPRLLRRIHANKMSKSQEERELVISARTWFVLYLFEHQLSYGVGRPAILRFDESIRDCRLLLKHPLSIEDDMRLVSTVELIIIREKVHNRLAQREHQIDEETFLCLREADADFRTWFQKWDGQFSKKHSDAGFYRQSLQIQQFFAELFHNATALRGISGPEDVANMPTAQRHVLVKSIRLAKAGLETTLQASAYRENLKYGECLSVHYTHATATFAASLLIRLARLMPQECDLHAIKKDVEELANVLDQTPSGRYARSLRYMLRRAEERRVLPGRSPSRPLISPDQQRSHGTPSRSPTQHYQPHVTMTYSPHPRMREDDSNMYPAPGGITTMTTATTGGHDGPPIQWYDPYTEPEMQTWATMELNTGAVMNNGMEAYMIPVGYDQQQEALPQIW